MQAFNCTAAAAIRLISSFRLIFDRICLKFAFKIIPPGMVSPTLLPWEAQLSAMFLSLRSTFKGKCRNKDVKRPSSLTAESCQNQDLLSHAIRHK